MRASWKQLVKLFESYGCRTDRISGDHIVMVHDQMSRPIVVKKDDDLGPDLLMTNFRTLADGLGLDVEDVKANLERLRSGKKPVRMKITALKKITDFLVDRLGRSYCQKCLSKQTGKHKQEVSIAVNELGALASFDLSPGKCTRCGKDGEVLTALPVIT